jgi:methylglutaconyl-CoA hydratase
LVAAADIAVASEDAVFGLPEVAIGLAPMVVMAPLVRAIGFRAVSALALTGERVSAATAAQIGLVTRVLPKDQLEATVTELCTQICSKGPLAIRETKTALADLLQSNLLSFMNELADRSALVSISAEAQEGLAAFQEKRAPAWKPT